MSSADAVAPTTLVRTIFERLAERDADALVDLGAPDVVEVWPVIGRLHGSQAVRDHFAAIFASMPDLHIGIGRMAADGETVFVHWHVTGTFTGAPFLGIEATGRRIDMRGTDCFTIRDGRVAANFIAYDGVTFAVQAGVLPPHGSRLDQAITAAANLATRGRKLLGR